MEINAMNDPETRDNVRKFIHYLSAYQRAFNLPGYIFEDLNHMCADAVFFGYVLWLQNGQCSASRDNVIVTDFREIEQKLEAIKAKERMMNLAVSEYRSRENEG